MTKFLFIAGLSVIEYLSKYVYLSSDKKQLYHRVFDKYLPVDKTTREDNENDDNLFGENSPINFNSRTIRRNNHAERFLPIDSLNTAMKEVLGFHGTVEKINEVRDLLNISESVDIDYRTFCGIIALSGMRVVVALENLYSTIFFDKSFSLQSDTFSIQSSINQPMIPETR